MLREIDEDGPTAEDEERADQEEEATHDVMKVLVEGTHDDQAIGDQKDTQIRMLGVVVEEEEGRQHDDEGAN